MEEHVYYKTYVGLDSANAMAFMRSVVTFNKILPRNTVVAREIFGLKGISTPACLKVSARIVIDNARSI